MSEKREQALFLCLLLRQLLLPVLFFATALAPEALWAAPASDGGSRVSVQLNWKHQFEFAAFYAAIDQGYYRAAGLNVDILEGGPGIDAVKEVSEGRATFGIGASALVVDRYRGLPVVALATLMQHSPVALLALRSKGVGSVHDLAGKPVAVDPHNRDEVEAYLRASGIPAERIMLVEQNDWTLDSLHQGKDVARTIYLSNESFLIRGKEHEYLILTPRSAGIDLFGNMLFSTQTTVRNSPESVKAFREATLKGLTYSLEHPGEISDLILQRYNTQGKSREHLIFEAAQIRELTRPDIVEPGYMSPGRWRHVVSVYASQGKLPADFELADFIYDPVPQAIPPWVFWGLGAAVFALLSALFFVFNLRLLNLRLQGEIGERQRAEESLRQQKEHFAATLNATTESIFLLECDGRVVLANETAARRLGTSCDEMVGRCVFDYFPAESAVHRRANMDEVIRSGKTLTTEDERNGHYFFLNFYPISGVDGQTRAVVVFAHDISAQKIAQKALVDSEALKAAVLMHAPYAIIATDLQGIITVFNPGAEALLGYRHDELIGLRTPDCFHDPDEICLRAETLSRELGTPTSPDFDAFVAKARLTGAADDREWTYIRKDGSRVPAYLSVTAMTDRNGKLIGYLGIATDITERRASEQRVARLLEDQQRILESDLVGIMRVRNRVFVWSNPAAEMIYGYAEGEMTGMPTRRLYANDTAYEAVGKAYATIATGQNFRALVDYIRKDGRRIWCDVSSKVLDFETGESLWTVLDVTHRVEAEEELTRYRDRLQELVVERTRELSRAKEEAERANQAKSVFLSNMSHELRTPMHAILSFGKLGLEKSLVGGDGTLPKLHRYFDHIVESGMRLMPLLNDLLDLSKLESGKMNYRMATHDLRIIVSEVVGEIGVLAEKKSITLNTESVPDKLLVSCDAGKIGQVVRNLLANAIKFSPDGSAVVLSAAPCDLPGRRAVDANNPLLLRKGVSFSVTDHGVGIPEDELETVFAPFVQSSHTITAAGGTGLGLSICREIIHGHRGSIMAFNNPEGGARFTFVLPV